MEAASVRLHFLDWLRAILVGFVVYAHLTFCGAQIDRPGDSGSVDDHAYNTKDPNPLSVRWQSIARQWVIPLFYWISGAASAMTFGSKPFGKGLCRVVVITMAGVAANATMWLLGPRDEHCSFREPCPGQGVLFDFTEDPFAGDIEPYVNQMWFTVALAFLMSMNWPLFTAMCRELDGKHRCNLLLTQWLVIVALIGSLIAASPHEFSQPWFLFLWIACSEAVFLVASVSVTSARRPAWLPLRLVQYACAVVALLQHCVPPIAQMQDFDISSGYVLYLLLCANKWFELGFLMTRPRSSLCATGDAGPLISKLWPLAIVPIVLCMPSTSWATAGSLPYPHFPRASDRVLYSGGTIVMFFLVDRCSRAFDCRPIPSVLGHASVILYTFQVVFITVFLRATAPLVRRDIRDGSAWSVLAILGLSAISSIALACAASWRRRHEHALTQEAHELMPA